MVLVVELLLGRPLLQSLNDVIVRGFRRQLGRIGDPNPGSGPHHGTREVLVRRHLSRLSHLLMVMMMRTLRSELALGEGGRWRRLTLLMVMRLQRKWLLLLSGRHQGEVAASTLGKDEILSVVELRR